MSSSCGNNCGNCKSNEEMTQADVLEAERQGFIHHGLNTAIDILDEIDGLDLQDKYVYDQVVYLATKANDLIKGIRR